MCEDPALPPFRLHSTPFSGSTFLPVSVSWVLTKAVFPPSFSPLSPSKLPSPSFLLSQVVSPLKALAHGQIHQETKFHVQADCRTPTAVREISRPLMRGEFDPKTPC